MARIIPLAMVDDLLAVSNCGYHSTAINTGINTIIELKKLQFHIPEAQKKRANVTMYTLEKLTSTVQA